MVAACKAACIPTFFVQLFSFAVDKGSHAEEAQGQEWRKALSRRVRGGAAGQGFATGSRAA